MFTFCLELAEKIDEKVCFALFRKNWIRERVVEMIRRLIDRMKTLLEKLMKEEERQQRKY